MVMTLDNSPLAWDARASRHREPWLAAGWSEYGQTQRMQAVRSHLPLRRRDTVLDYGCGTGRFCEFLPANIDYLAYDTSPLMRARCQREHHRATVLDDLGDRRFDHVVAIGPFNLASSQAAVFVQLEKLWERCRMTLVASLYRGEDERCLRFDPADVTSLAARLAVRYTVDASVLDNDLLLVLRR